MHGASVAAVALADGINANLLFKWRRDHLRSKRLTGAALPSAVLVPVRVAPSLGTEAGNSQPLMPSPAPTSTATAVQRVSRNAGTIELDIAGAVLRLRCPVDEASLCSVLRALRQST